MRQKSKVVRKIPSIISTIIDECDTITRGKLAVEAEVNQSYLSHIIKSFLGVSYSYMRREARMTKAAEMLREDPDIPIKSVAYEVGYKSPAYFGALFKARFSFTPGEYQDNHRKKDDKEARKTFVVPSPQQKRPA